VGEDSLEATGQRYQIIAHNAGKFDSFIAVRAFMEPHRYATHLVQREQDSQDAGGENHLAGQSELLAMRVASSAQIVRTGH